MSLFWREVRKRREKKGEKTNKNDKEGETKCRRNNWGGKFERGQGVVGMPETCILGNCQQHCIDPGG